MRTSHRVGLFRFTICVFVGWIATLSTPSTAQQSTTNRIVVHGVVMPAEQLPAAAERPMETAQGAVAPPEAEQNPRLAALLKLGFDRRREAILAAWSQSVLPLEDQQDQKNEKAEEDRKDKEDKEDQQDKEDREDQEDTKKEQKEKESALQKEVQQFAKWVTLSEWDKVGAYLRELPADDAKKVYDHLLKGLGKPALSGPQSGRGEMPDMPGGMAVMQAAQMQMWAGGNGQDPGINLMTPDDILGVLRAAPCEFSEERLKKLGALLKLVSRSGHVLDSLVPALEQGIEALGGSSLKGRLKAARLFLNAGELDLAKPFLPDWQDETVREDKTAVNVLSDYYHAAYARRARQDDLSLAWEIHQALSSFADLNPEVQEKALLRLTDYSTKVEKELGQTWLEQSFTEDVHRGIRVLTLLGSAAATNTRTQLRNPRERLAGLRLQNLAAEALVKMLPAQVPSWRMTLTRLAENWIREAELAQQFTRDTSQRLEMQWDSFGNVYYMDPDAQMRRFGPPQDDQPQPIPVRDLLEIKPGDGWLAGIDHSLQPQFAIRCAELHLKINAEEDSFPYIEQVAGTHPQKARSLVHSFLRVWTRNHDPNSIRRMYNPYMYIYGYDEQADSIPLTRSKQQRNLADLKKWVSRIRELPIEPIDESYLANAFTTCHSSAEVYRLEAFEEVFGNLDLLKPETIADIAGKMRTNLSSVWRKVEVQEAYKTKRKEQDVQQAVLRGYDVAIAVVERAQQAHPENWQLQLAAAALHFDNNAYQQTVRKDSEFVARRLDAFDQFAKAAQLYAQVVSDLDKSKQTTQVYDTWFYAALGASQLRDVSHENVPQTMQYQLIRQAILALPPAAAEYHMGEFASQLFTRMSSVQPQVKFRYVRGGFAIVGDHPRAREARRSLDYYTDVVEEIKLVTRLDGSDEVGHGQPFGVFVSLWHTTEMERESGGFEKYVQNQNAMASIYNYGRPPENYREKFQEAATKALRDHFDVVSVTFENAKNMRSRPTTQDGWRETPFAYLLVKAHGKEVDSLPSLQLDLDFLDVNGFVVIPIESAPLVIDASADKVAMRPVHNVKIVQTLDERQATEGKLIMEIKATANGLAPDLDHLLHLNSPGFEVVIDDDQGVVPSEFDPQSDEIKVLSDRSWLVSLVAKPDRDKGAGDFTFFETKLADARPTYQRYDDADLVSVERTVSLAHRYGRRRLLRSRTAGIVGLVALSLMATIYGVRQFRKPVKVAAGYEVPDELNPFTMLSLLHRICEDHRFDEHLRAEARDEIHHLQRHYFARANGDAPLDLRAMADRWVARTT